MSQVLTLLKGGLSLNIFSPGLAGDSRSRSGGLGEQTQPARSRLRAAFVRKSQGAGPARSQAAKGQAHPLLPGFRPGHPLLPGNAGPKQAPENRPHPSSQLPCVCFHSCSSCSTVPVSKGICLRKRMWQRGGRQRAQAASQLQSSPGAARRAGESPKDLKAKVRLRDTLHLHSPDGPAFPWARTLPRVFTASARLAA